MKHFKLFENWESNKQFIINLLMTDYTKNKHKSFFYFIEPKEIKNILADLIKDDIIICQIIDKSKNDIWYKISELYYKTQSEKLTKLNNKIGIFEKLLIK
jgi:hypothetical protein